MGRRALVFLQRGHALAPNLDGLQFGLAACQAQGELVVVAQGG
jgi:hypothetical protein